MKIVLKTDIPELKLFARGKVRDIYEINSYLLIVATDRISAFDVVLPSGIPQKGVILTEMTTFWFNFLRPITPNHLVTSDFREIKKRIKGLDKYEEILNGRSMLVKKCEVFPVECIVRGYLAGSAFKEYQATGTICGIQLPKGLREYERLNNPIFTPATKAPTGHDENITFAQMCEIVGKSVAEVLKKRSLEIYEAAHKYAFSRGIIISDTKFEWGILNNEILLVDEVLTPDSSRFWPRDSWIPGKSPPSFDKQFVRDYLEFINWDKTPPAPELPQEIIAKTREKYLEARERLIGKLYKKV